jgi:hypothetical protein
MGVADKVSVIVPVSPGPGVYTGFNVLGNARVPVPLCVQARDVVYRAVAAETVKVAFWQITPFGPASIKACFAIVRCTTLLALAQDARPAAVRVRSTPPAAISAALGVYTGVSIELLSKDPLPDVVHNKEE